MFLFFVFCFFLLCCKMTCALLIFKPMTSLNAISFAAVMDRCTEMCCVTNQKAYVTEWSKLA